MKIINGHSLSPSLFERPKATLGLFDGMHIGHQAVLRQLLTWARGTDSEAVVITFDRKPHRVLTGRPLEQITSLPHRLRLFERAGMDAVVVLEFDQALAEMEPEEFVAQVLVERMGVTGVLLGHDTRFGRKGRGDHELMTKLGACQGFEVCWVPVVMLEGEAVSSTRVRQALCKGALALAERLLGRRFSVYGTVVRGTSRGRGFGFPTANLGLDHAVEPPQGVYATRTLIDGRWHGSVTNIGRLPTLQAQGPAYCSTNIVVETHVMDFAGDLYGKEIEVEFIERIRGEQVFTSPAALAERIAMDIRIARERLAELRQRG